MHADRIVKMHKARQPAQGVHAREPALINLPIPIPSNIPILSPILDPLVAGLPASDFRNFPSNLPPLDSLPPLISLPLPTPHTTSPPQQTSAPQPSPFAPAASPTTPVSSPTLPVSVPVVTPTPPPIPSFQPTAPATQPPAPSPQPPAPAPAPQSPSPAPAPASAPEPQPQPQPQTPSQPPSPPSNPPPPSNNDNGGSATGNAPPSTGGNGGDGKQSGGGESSGNGAGSGNAPPSPGDAVPPSASPAPVNGAAPPPASPSTDSSANANSVSAPAAGAGASQSSGVGINLNGASVLRTLTLPDGQPVPVPTQNAAVNVGGNPATETGIANLFPGTSSTVTFSSPGAAATGPNGSRPGSAGSPGGGDGDGGSGGGQSSGANPGSTNNSAVHHGISTGVIAAIAVVGALILLALLVFCCRRRAISQRLARRRRWFRGEKTTSIYGVPPVSSSGYFRENPPSARSSFGTSYEHQVDPFSVVPPVPLSPEWPLYRPQSMAQADNSVLVTLPTAAATTYSPPSPTLRGGSRSSTGSYESISSIETPASAHSAQGQVLMAPPRNLFGEPLTPDSVQTPISVRPFSPSERWAFPLPPSSARRSAGLQAPARSYSTTPESYATSDYLTAPESANPFSDASAVDDDSADGHTSTETFVTADTDAAAHFPAAEPVARPFTPTMPDEMRVQPGDVVHVLKRYDDGWAYAENRATGARGLFPIDCLRMPDQDLPSFLAEKRLSSYAGVKPPSRPLSRLDTVQEHEAM